jgi:pilus assembly protein Flp/PilA
MDHVRNLMMRIYLADLKDLKREEGQTMTEYGVLLALIAVGVIAVLLLLGPKIAKAFQQVNNAL